LICCCCPFHGPFAPFVAPTVGVHVCCCCIAVVAVAPRCVLTLPLYVTPFIADCPTLRCDRLLPFHALPCSRSRTHDSGCISFVYITQARFYVCCPRSCVCFLPLTFSLHTTHTTHRTPLRTHARHCHCTQTPHRCVYLLHLCISACTGLPPAFTHHTVTTRITTRCAHHTYARVTHGSPVVGCPSAQRTVIPSRSVTTFRFLPGWIHGILVRTHYTLHTPYYTTHTGCYTHLRLLRYHTAHTVLPHTPFPARFRGSYTHSLTAVTFPVTQLSRIWLFVHVHVARFSFQLVAGLFSCTVVRASTLVTVVPAPTCRLPTPLHTRYCSCLHCIMVWLSWTRCLFTFGCWLLGGHCTVCLPHSLLRSWLPPHTHHTHYTP